LFFALSIALIVNLHGGAVGLYLDTDAVTAPNLTVRT